MWLRLLPLFALTWLLLAGCSAEPEAKAPAPQPPAKSYSRPTAEEIQTVLPRDAIPAILEPEFLSVSEANKLYADSEPIIGVEIEGQAHAYSTVHLNHHEIVNDEVAGNKIAVTW